jgi:hypothetical protein
LLNGKSLGANSASWARLRAFGIEINGRNKSDGKL